MTKKTYKHNKTQHIGRKIALISLGAILLLLASAFLYFENHFLPNTQVAGLDVSYQTPFGAKTAFDARNQKGTVVALEFPEGEKSFTLNNLYQEFTLADFQAVKKGKTLKLKLNPDVAQNVINAVAALDMENAKNDNRAKIAFNPENKEFEVQNAQTQAVLDTEKISKAIYNQLGQYHEKLSENSKDFMKEVYPQNILDLQVKANELNNLPVVATFAFKNNQVQITKDELADFIQEPNSIAAFVRNTIYEQLSTTGDPIKWKNPSDNHIYEFINNQSYGWNVDMPATTVQIQQMIEQNNYGQTFEPVVKATFSGGVEDVISKNFVWIDTDKQIMQLWKDGKMINQTDVITGFWNKGTATVSGFQTVSWKTDFINMKGAGLNGSDYNVPIHYAECLLYRPYNSSTTGNHEEPYETGIFIHQADKSPEDFANKNDMQARPYGVGSNGCIGVPPNTAKIYYDTLTNGYPVIVTGHFYDDAPGDFDKPVDYGKVIQ